MMLKLEEPLQVNLTKVTLKRDSEGGKWATLALSFIISSMAALTAPLKAAVSLMDKDDALDSISTADEMQNVRLEFTPVGVSKAVRKVFEVTTLTGFQIVKEKAQQSGTLKSERTGKVKLTFNCAVPMMIAGMWALDNFGNDIMLEISKAQAELPLDTTAAAEEPAPAGAELSPEEMIADAEAESGEGDAGSDGEAQGKGARKKAKKR